ncbi:hypothetical protein DFJ74DRAFT_440179 [Hyaloraphidium curvatum]|nr:hypothetical protein DFJ74DRAFT_440179 [Hyaloraphidium curvatum]
MAATWATPTTSALLAATASALASALQGDGGAAPADPGGPSPAAAALTVVLLVLANALSVVGGIGGGGFFVLILAMTRTAHDAVPLSSALIFASNSVLLYSNWHLVDFEAAALMQPACLAGTVIGVYFNVVSPPWLLLILLSAVLAFSTWRTLAKAVDMWHGETARAWKPVPGSDPTQRDSLALEAFLLDDDQTLLDESNRPSMNGAPEGGAGSKDPAGAAPGAPTEEEQQEDGEAELFDIRDPLAYDGPYLFALFVTFASVLASSIAKSFITPGSAASRLVSLIPLPTSMCITAAVLFVVLRRERERSEPLWTSRRCWITILASLGAGIGASALGVGGGIFFGPLLLELGGPHPDPLKTTALSSMLVLLTSGASTVQYAVRGKLAWGSVLFLSTFMVLSAIAAYWGTRRAIALLGRKSIIVIALGVGLGLSALIAMGQAILALTPH